MKTQGRFAFTTTLLMLPAATSVAHAQYALTIAHSEQGRVHVTCFDGSGAVLDVNVDPLGNGNPSGNPHCPADLDDGTFTGTPDGGVSVDDLLFFLYAFERGMPIADLDGGQGNGIPDGGVTIDDLLYFLSRFEIGC